MDNRWLESLEDLIREGRELNIPGECHYVESLDWLNRVHEMLTPYPEAQERFRLSCLDSCRVIQDKTYWALKILTDILNLEKTKTKQEVVDDYRPFL